MSFDHSTFDPTNGEDGPPIGNLAPFLLTLLLNNVNNTDTQPAPDTLDARNHALEFKTPNLFTRPSVILSSTEVEGGDEDVHPIADTLVVTRSALEMKPKPVLNLRGNITKPFPRVLDDNQLQFWRDNGYLTIPDALPKQVVTDLLQTVQHAAEQLTDGGKHVEKLPYLPGQRSYVSPVGRVVATLTQGALNPDAKPLQRIQRLGCGIHRIMPTFRQAIMSPFHEQIVKSLGYNDPRIIQSLVIVKAAEVGARVVPHQDGCSGFTDPPSCTTFWYALEDATNENGCLAVAPGSHRIKPIMRRCRKDETGRAEFVDLQTPVFAQIDGVSANSLPASDENGELVYKKLEVKAGTLVLMHGNMMHMSEANRSDKSRVAFNFGIVEGTHEWPADNYLQPYEGDIEFEKLRAL